MSIKNTVNPTLKKVTSNSVHLGSLLNQFDALAPSDLALTVLSEISIKLDWINNSTNADGVSIERSTDGTTYSELTTVSATTATYTDTTGADGIRYYYRLKSYKGTTYSEASTAANDYTWFKALLEATGTGAGVSTLRLEVSATQTITLDGAARFYTDSGGTTGESTTWEVTPGALSTIYLKCASGTANMLIPKPQNVVKFGNSALLGWISAANSSKITITVAKLGLTELRIEGNSVILGALPSGLIYCRLDGNAITWAYTGALPIGLNYLLLSSNTITWTYTGALPTGLKTLSINSPSVWIYSGALPSGITTLRLGNSNLIEWTYSGALPSGNTNIYFNGAKLNWTSLDIGNANITAFDMLNYRLNKMSSADMVTFLTNLTNRTGTLPATITINDYADYASPPAEVVAAVAALKLAKSITTVNLGS